MTSFKNAVYLAPLAGVSDAAFRLISRQHGADLCYTEMISANGLKYNNRNTEKMFYSFPDEKEKAVQFFGPDADTILYAVDYITRFDDISVIDINMGCPMPKIIKNHEGAFLMTVPDKACEIIKKVKQRTLLPVTAKIRRGFSPDDDNAVSFSKRLEDEGLDAVTVHGRYASQYYEGKADWDIIRQVKDALTIPVIGNGDIIDGKSAAAMFEYTGCDSVMIGRGALGNPFIFREVKAYLSGADHEPVSLEEKLQVLLKQAELACIEKGESVGMKQMRKHAIWYIHGMYNASKYKTRLSSVRKLDDLKNIINEISEDI